VREKCLGGAADCEGAEIIRSQKLLMRSAYQSEMKLQAVIDGDKIDEMDYRFFLFYEVIELGCEKFFSCIRFEGGSRRLIVRIEGNDAQLSEFKHFVEDQKPEGVQISGITFEEFTGKVASIETFLAFCIAELLDRWSREYKSTKNRNDIIPS